jgi:hypothetical protein
MDIVLVATFAERSCPAVNAIVFASFEIVEGERAVLCGTARWFVNLGHIVSLDCEWDII